MSRASLLADVQSFVGSKVNDCIDQIKASATRNRFSVEVHDPKINTWDIDREETRLDIFQDADGKIISFSIG